MVPRCNRSYPVTGTGEITFGTVVGVLIVGPRAHGRRNDDPFRTGQSELASANRSRPYFGRPM
jgi:hypothetical protein